MSKKFVDVGAIEQWLKDENSRIRIAAMNACQGREIPIEVIERGLQDSKWRVRQAAMDACVGRDVPLEVIWRGLQDFDCDVRLAAMDACQGREVPAEIIEQGVKDTDADVRVAAINVCKANGLPVPVIRTFEPPEQVYKKCVNGVIVVAEIPKDAQVRGRFGCKCRASKAVIKDVIGDIHGVKVGISTYDLKTLYFVGDKVEIDDFDYGDEESSTGFHFVCTRQEAEIY